ncbi:MAG TPA: hypothetical protein VNK04_22640 [Gemmataceae bacterium]|nr:hypothetical protein [Gemmataceae bacterium]
MIRYGLPLRANQRGPVVIAHEQEGLDGRRFVVYAGSHGVEEVDDARFKELVP